MVKLLPIFTLLTFSLNSKASVGYQGLSLSTGHTFLVLEREQELFNVQRSKISANGGIAKLSYGFDFGLSLGVAHRYGTGTSDKARQFGPMVGFNYEGFSAVLSYMINPEYKFDDNMTYTNGKVFIAELSYHFKFANYFVLGATLAYDSEEYNSIRTALGETNSKFVDNGLMPFISIGVLFDFLGASSYEEGF